MHSYSYILIIILLVYDLLIIFLNVFQLNILYSKSKV